MVPVARIGVAILATVVSFPASADLVQLSYTEQAIAWNDQMDAIAVTQDLDLKSTFAAKRIAASWVLIGSCRRPAASIDPSSVRVVMQSAGTNKFEVAVLAMISVLSRENLGREPPENVCLFAKDIGK